MQFYTYAYLQSQAQVNHMFQYALIFIIVAGLILFSILYLHDRLQTKYRDLGVIFFLIGLFLLGANWGDYSHSREDTAGLSRMTKFLDTFSDNLIVPKSKMAVNSLRPQSGMLVKVGDDFYRVDFNADNTAYRINRVYLIEKQDMKLVDSEADL